ncbi:SCO7613 C-terminal domain-containing membrane protein [Streptomyces sp. NPDC003691]
MNPFTPPLPPAEELALVDRELARLEAHRAQLLMRRAWLLAALRVPAAPRARAGAGTPYAVPAGGGPAGGGTAAGRAGETTGRGTQNTLLILGGVLLAVAAIAFTVLSWGSLGIGGRGAVLAAVTAAALTAPVPLLRRGLGSTAESVAGLGLLLTVLDAYAVRQAGLAGGDSVLYAAAAAAVLAALWAGYGRLLPGLVLPLPAAVVAAQFPLLLWAAAEQAPVGWAATATAGFDVAVALWASRRSVRRLAAVGAVVTGGHAVLAAVTESVLAQRPAETAGPALHLTVIAAIALAAAARSGRAAVPAAAAGAVLVLAAGGPLRELLPPDWAVLAYALPAAALTAAAGTRLPRSIAGGLAGAGAGALGAAVLLTLPLTVLALTGPVTALPGLWRGAPGDAYTAVGAELSHAFFAPAPLLLLLAAGAAEYVRRVRFRAADPEAADPAAAAPRDVRPAAWARIVAAVLLWAALATVPAAVRMEYPAAVAYGLLLALAAFAGAARGRAVPVPVALICGLLGAVGTAGLALSSRPATFAVLGVLLVASVAAAAVTRSGAAVQAVFAVAAAGFGGWLLLAVARAAELTAAGAGLLLMLVPAVACAVAARGPGNGEPAEEGTAPAAPVVALETTAAVAGATAVLLASGNLPMTALLLGLAGVIAAATALRPERRRPAGATAAALFVLASWARLAAWEVTAPEAYALPVAAPALAVGVLLRRRAPETSSWTAYGPGLAAGLLPSLFAVWGDPGPLRPLLLGAAALALTLHGARGRLQAPLVLGGTVLALVALHELAPYVVQMAGLLPRWLPPALAGLLLLVVGATYEQRLRDARRLRDSVHRMR